MLQNLDFYWLLFASRNRYRGFQDSHLNPERFSLLLDSSKASFIASRIQICSAILRYGRTGFVHTPADFGRQGRLYFQSFSRLIQSINQNTAEHSCVQLCSCSVCSVFWLCSVNLHAQPKGRHRFPNMSSFVSSLCLPSWLPLCLP